MPTAKKGEKIQDMVEMLDKSLVSVITEYRGLKVSDITELRKKLRPSGTEYHVAKNTLVRRAANQLGFTGMDEALSGPTAIAFIGDDMIKGIKSLLDYQKTSKVFTVKAGIVGGKLIQQDRLEDLTKLPPKEQLISKLMGSLKSPASNLVNVLSAPPRNLVNVLDATPRNLVNVLNQRKQQLEEGA